MVTTQQVSELALSFEGVEAKPHHHKTAFRTKKRIFATLDEKAKTLTVKLSAVDQSVFCEYDENVIYPVPNKWGNQGWTIVELESVPEEMFRDMVGVAYEGAW
ncbi:MAG: MmcQ/YjbR family DNA-binding protein [Cyclobacteriaceae bacterium]